MQWTDGPHDVGSLRAAVDDAHGHQLVRGQGAGLVEQTVGHLASQRNSKRLRAEDARLDTQTPSFPAPSYFYFSY